MSCGKEGGDFLEGEGAGVAGGVLDGDVAGGGYARDTAHEVVAAQIVAVGMIAFPAPHTRGVEGAQFIHREFEHAHDCGAECGGKRPKWMGMPRELPDRNGVGRIGTELPLVDVDTYAGNRARYVAPRQRVLDEYARYLAVSHIDVVGPLDEHLHAREQGGEHLHHPKSHSARYVELTCGLGGLRTEHDGEGEVESRLRLPAVATLSAPGCLPAGHDYVAVGQRAGMGGGVGVGGVYGVKRYHLH